MVGKLLQHHLFVQLHITYNLIPCMPAILHIQEEDRRVGPELKAQFPVIQEKSKMWVWTKRSFSVSNRSWFAVWKTSWLILDDRIYIIYFANPVLMTGLSSQHLKITKQSKFLSSLTNYKQFNQ